jgi:Acyclic terpene utilisation family protein AtuA
VGTVCEQMLYEIGDPAAYILPDVILDLRAVEVTQEGGRFPSLSSEGVVSLVIYLYLFLSGALRSTFSRQPLTHAVALHTPWFVEDVVRISGVSGRAPPAHYKVRQTRVHFVPGLSFFFALLLLSTLCVCVCVCVCK